MLRAHHEAFAVTPEERGKTNLVTLEINTGTAPPMKEAVEEFRLHFDKSWHNSLEIWKLRESYNPLAYGSPWASPIVLVWKKDGSLCFCVDYRSLNWVNKKDTFSLPRVDNFAKYFSTLDLAAGYWQIKVHVNLREKTAFITPKGLYKFRVMPFGLANAPATFQRLMQQRVLMGLNEEMERDFVSVYIDDILISSRTLEDHIHHIKLVLQHIITVGLKLKPAKCFLLSGLGHIIIPHDLRVNTSKVTAVENFPHISTATSSASF